jgi:hypothetical protein
MVGPPIFVCHEMTPEEAEEANKEKNIKMRLKNFSISKLEWFKKTKKTF